MFDGYSKCVTRTRKNTILSDFLRVRHYYCAVRMQHFNIQINITPQWLRHCATNRKVVGSIPDGFTGIFH
jgi:hypothetical protein